MYAILNNDNSIGDFDTRDIPLTELVMDEFRHLYVEIPSDHTLKIGDIWLSDTNEWEIVDVKEPIVTKQPYVPTNTEIAQMISDLQADLIIAGVI